MRLFVVSCLIKNFTVSINITKWYSDKPFHEQNLSKPTREAREDEGILSCREANTKSCVCFLPLFSPCFSLLHHCEPSRGQSRTRTPQAVASGWSTGETGEFEKSEHFDWLLRNDLNSLRSKRFRGVFCTKKPIFLFLDAREMGWERKKEGGGEERSSPLPPPPCFCSRPISRASKTTKIVFLAKNATVTLATQATTWIVLPQKSQSRTQSPLAFWSAGGRQERLWGTGICYRKIFFSNSPDSVLAPTRWPKSQKTLGTRLRTVPQSLSWRQPLRTLGTTDCLEDHLPVILCRFTKIKYPSFQTNRVDISSRIFIQLYQSEQSRTLEVWRGDDKLKFINSPFILQAISIEFSRLPRYCWRR